jgi:hypothetical protein
MHTDVIALNLIVRERINSRIAEAANDHLADQLPTRPGWLAAFAATFVAAAATLAATLASALGAALTAITSAFGATLAAITIALAQTLMAARIATAHALRGLAADIDPCARGDAGLLIARSR